MKHSTKIFLCGFVLLNLCILLVSCAKRDFVLQPLKVLQGGKDVPFRVAGRFSVKVDGRGYVANFSWLHERQSDELEMTSPIGLTVARLVRAAHEVGLTIGEKTWYASDVDTLTEQQLGWPLPMANLVWWIRGQIAPNTPATIKEDGSLVQQGWTIRFFADQNAASFPRRIDLSRDNLLLRVILNKP